MTFCIFIASERLNDITRLFSYLLLPFRTDTQFCAILEPSLGHCNNASFIYFNEPPNPLRKMYIRYICNLDNFNSNKQLCIISPLEINADNVSTDLEKYLYNYAADYNRNIYFQSIKDENILREEMDKVLLEKRLRKEAFENAELKSKSIEMEKEKEYILIKKEMQLMSIEEERVRAFLLIEKERQIFEEEIEKQRIVLDDNKKKILIEIENKRLIEEANLKKLELEVNDKRLFKDLEKQRKAKEAEQKRLFKEAEKQRKTQEAEQKRLFKEAEKQRKVQEVQEAEEKRLFQEAEKQRKAQEAEEKRLFQEAEKQRKAQEAEDQRLLQEAEKQRKAQEAEDQRLLQEAEKQRKLENKLMVIEEKLQYKILEKEKKNKLKNDKSIQKLQKRKEEQDLENFLNSAIKENILKMPVVNRGYLDIPENMINTIKRFNKCNIVFQEFICIVTFKDDYDDAVTNTVISEKFTFTLDYLEIIVMDRLLTENIFEAIPIPFRTLIREIIKIIFAGIFDIYGKGKVEFRNIDKCYENKLKLSIAPDLVNKISTSIVEIVTLVKNGDKNPFMNKLVFPFCYEFMIKIYCRAFELLNKITNKVAFDNVRRELSIFIFLYMFNNHGESYHDIQMPLSNYVTESVKFLENKFNCVVKKFNIELIEN
jgi:hypothetical protein